METVTDFILLGSQITADNDYSHEITLAPWKKNYDKHRQHIKKAETSLCQQNPYSQFFQFSCTDVRIRP